MAVSLENFVKQLEDSGILAGDTLKDYIPPKASPKDATDLARELVRQKKLTKFQAEEVSKGKGKSLVLGNYLLMEKIGAGGMGQVFKARHRRMDRFVAVKLLPTAMTKDKAAIARFEREVKAAAKLRHPNIVAADDADCANGVHFLVMEMVEGSDLSALVKKNGPFSIEEAVDYVLQAAKGLEFAHKKGVVHRDIKPANLLLDDEGVVKILDMGLARLNGDDDGSPQADLTNTGTIMGTVDYMAPEQALDTKTADARADIYALGCSLYYLLTGKSTYDGDTLMKRLMAHREQPIPSLRAARPEVSDPLVAVFQKMVAKKIEDRYQTMTELLVELETCCGRNEQTVALHQPMASATAAGTTDLFKELLTIPSPPPIQRKKVTHPLMGFNGKDKKSLLLTGGGLLGVLILLAGLVVTLKTKDGTLIVTVSEPDADVQVQNEEGKVEITRKGDKGPITISVDPGKHRLKVTKDGFTVFGQDFEIEAGAKQPITAKLVPLEGKPAMVGTKPAPVPAETKSPVVAGAKKPLAFETPGFDPWVKEVAALPAEKQVEAVSKKLVELNPGFDGKMTGVSGSDTPNIENGLVTALTFLTDNVTDISPVRALAGLTILSCSGSEPGKGELTDLSPIKSMPLTVLFIQSTQVFDLAPLQGMPLTALNIHFTQVADLAPLQGMKLTALYCAGARIADLSPLKGMPLTHLQIESTQVSDLSPLQGMPLTTLQMEFTQVTDLSPLTGLPLSFLTIHRTRISDLSPLQGMPLTYLGCYETLVADFSPLNELPLQQLVLHFTPDRDTALLRSIKTLETINEKPAAEFCEKVEAYQAEAKRPLAFEAPGFEQWVKETSALPAEEQVNAVAKKLMELNPGFDGKVTGGYGLDKPIIENGVVTRMAFFTDNVTDLSPVRALGGLSSLEIYGSALGQGKLISLSPLKGLPITALSVYFTQVSDLSPVRGMKLTYLHCGNTFVSDLSPLKGMQLEALDCGGTRVHDLSPLNGMPLKELKMNATLVSDLSPLQGMKLTLLWVGNFHVTDLSPLKGMPLKELLMPFNTKRDTELLRSIKTLETINTKPAAEFWKEVEEQQKGMNQ